MRKVTEEEVTVALKNSVKELEKECMVIKINSAISMGLGFACVYTVAESGMRSIPEIIVGTTAVYLFCNCHTLLISVSAVRSKILATLSIIELGKEALEIDE